MFASITGICAVALLGIAQAGSDHPLTIPPPPPNGTVRTGGFEELLANKKKASNPAGDQDLKALEIYRALMVATMANQKEEGTRLKGELLFNHPASTFTRFVCFQEKWTGIMPAFMSRLTGRQKCLTNNEFNPVSYTHLTLPTKA